jgi:GAF domain-containing protein
MLDGATAGLELAEIAASADPLPRRAEQLLAVLRRYIPFDSGWLALADPQHPRYATLASADLADGTRAFLESPEQAHDIEAVGLHGPAPPLDPSDLPYPVEELPGWAECLIPAGYRGGLSLSLVANGGRHVGFLGLPCASQEPPSPEARRLLAQVSALLGRAVDPARTLTATTHLVRDAHAGWCCTPTVGSPRCRGWWGIRCWPPAPERWPPPGPSWPPAGSISLSCGRWAAGTRRTGTRA